MGSDEGNGILTKGTAMGRAGSGGSGSNPLLSDPKKVSLLPPSAQRSQNPR